MDFFEHQERARRWSSRIVWLFLLVVAVVVLAVNFAAAAAYAWWRSAQVYALADGGPWWSGVDPRVYFYATGITLIVVFGGAIYRSVQLAQGGKAVAQLVGARRVRRNTEQADERRLLNVVEEMAIASGTLLPQVYVMDDEQGMNAFAAGYQPHEAVVVVTAGLLQSLDRDELQGVIAHEFSHIFNGDMRLNVRMLSMLNGVSMIGSLGRHLLRGLRHEPRAAPWLGTAGLVLLMIGSLGVFAARLLKAAVSRQREYLADSSAVQFTRNNSGIGRALMKIYQHATGGVVDSRYAEELSHFFFAEGRLLWWSGLLATHPPLLERIRRVAPHLLRMDKRGAWVPRELTMAEQTEAAAAALAATTSAAGDATAALVEVTSGASASTSRNVEQWVAKPSATQVTYAADFFLRLAPQVKRALREANGRAALVCCLVVEREWTTAQRAAVKKALDAERAQEVFDLIEPVRALGVVGRMPLLELAVPGLRQLTSDAQRSLRSLLDELIAADGRIDMWEWIVATTVEYVLEPPLRHDKHRRLGALKSELASVLGALAYTDTDDDEAARRAFARATDLLGWHDVVLPDRRALGLDAVREAMLELTHVTPPLRRDVLRACAAVVLADQKVAPRELELLRAVAVVLECPMPPRVYELAASSGS